MTDYPYDAMMDSNQSTILAADFPPCPRDIGFMCRPRTVAAAQKGKYIMRESDKADRNPSGVDQTATDKPVSKITSRQVVAMTGIILLVLLYIIALIAAVVDTSSSGKLFMLCLFATVAIPILIWIYTWMYGKLRNRQTFADFRSKEQVQEDRTIPEKNTEQEDEN